MSQRTNSESQIDGARDPQEIGLPVGPDAGHPIQKRGRFQVGDVKDTLKLYAALALLLEGGLGALVVIAPTSTVQLSAVIGMIGVFALMVVIAGRNWESSSLTGGNFEEQLREIAGFIDPLWGEEHHPLDPDQVRTLFGTWRCEWTARDSTSELQPYVDDTVTVDEVDPETGEITATGTQTYQKNPRGYKLRGRASNQGLAHLYYRYPDKVHREKVGMVILRIDFVNEVAEGWWLGGGRGHGTPDVGGLVTWTKADRFEGDWTDRAYGFKPEQ